MLKSEYLKKNHYKDAFIYALKRYSSIFKSEYFSRTKHMASVFYDRFFLKLASLHKQYEWKKFYEEYLSKPIAYLHTNMVYQVTSLKGDGAFRYFYIPNLYLVILYELYISFLIRLVEAAFKNSELKKFLINWKFFSYAHQISKKWSLKYYDFWKKYLDQEKQLIQNHNYYLKTDIKAFYDSIPHDDLCKLLSQFLKDYVKKEDYIKHDLDNYLSEFYDILFKISRYTNKGLPQGLRWSDYLAVLFLWLIFFYERENLGLIIQDSYYWKMKTDSCFILYSDDILFVANAKQWLFNDLNSVKEVLYNYGLTINQNKTTDIMESLTYRYLQKIDIKKVKNKDVNELGKLKRYIIDTLRNGNLDEIWWSDFKAYFKWSFLLDFTNTEKQELFTIFMSIYAQRDKLNSQKIGILLLTISESSVALIFNAVKNVNQKVDEIFLQFIETFKNILADSTLLGILKYFCTDASIDMNLLRHSVIKILKEKKNPVIDCFIENDTNFFSPYCKATNLQGLDALLALTTENDVKWNTEQFQENIIWLKLNNLFGISLNHNFSKLKNLPIWQGKEKLREEFTYQIAEVVDSLLYQKYRNPLYFMKTGTFIADLFSLVNQLISILVALKRGTFEPCHISFTRETDLDVILIWEKGKENSRAKESFLQNNIYIRQSDRLFFYYVQKKRAKLQHKESVSEVDFSVTSYNISKYENSEILLNSTKIILESLCSQISDKLKYYDSE